jgi:uncharacterized membrane protein YhiD involved in acid resistance
MKAAGAMLVACWLLLAPSSAAAQAQGIGAASAAPAASMGGDDQLAHWDLQEQLTSLRGAAMSLPLAAVLGAALALRPRRRGTPPRSAPVIQTQIILAIVGAIVMLVVGASLARAFGIVGAASLIRYRAKVEDPKDAGVMLSTLSIGLAAGVGLYALAVAGTVFVIGVLWVVESFEPERYNVFELTVKAPEAAALRPRLERALRRHGVAFDLRTSAPDEVCYQVRVPLDRRTDQISNAIQQLDGAGATEVVWDEKKVKT